MHGYSIAKAAAGCYVVSSYPALYSFVSLFSRFRPSLANRRMSGGNYGKPPFPIFVVVVVVVVVV